MHPLRVRRTYVVLGFSSLIAFFGGFVLVSIGAPEFSFYVLCLMISLAGTTQVMRGYVGGNRAGPTRRSLERG
jgi:hypothetical protein